MGTVDYILDIVRSPLDLLHIIFYVILIIVLVAYAFYTNSKEDCDVLTKNITLI